MIDNRIFDKTLCYKSITMQTSNIPFITVTRKGQATIPAEVREHLGIKPKDKVNFAIQDDGSVTVAPAQSHVLATFGVVKPHPPAPVDFQALRNTFEVGVAEYALKRR